MQKPSRRVAAREAGTRLHDWLVERLIAVPVTELGRAVKEGAVTLEGARARTDTRLEAGQTVVWDPAFGEVLRKEGRWTQPWERAVPSVHEDEALLVVDKPAGMHVHPLGKWREETLLNALLFRAGARSDDPFGDYRPHPAHRLDRAARGLIAVAKSSAARDALRRALEEGRVHRRYFATVTGRVEQEEGLIDAPLDRDPRFDYRRAVVPGGKPARTRYRVLERKESETVLEVTLETGRTHQIRAHLASIGHPIAGDALYASDSPSRSDAAEEIELVAVALALPHPVTGAILSFSIGA